MKQAIMGKSFWVSLLVFVIVMVSTQCSELLKAWELLQQVWQEQGKLSQAVVLPNGFHSTLFFGALESDAFFLVSPILCTLPFSSTVLDEIKSGFIKSYLPRTSRNRYVIGKLLSNLMVGGILLVVGLTIVYMLFLLSVAPFEKGTIPTTYYFTAFVEKVPILFLFGGWNGVMGLTLGTVTQNKYMCYGSPFVVVYMLLILQERYIPECYVISVREWICPQQEWIFGNRGIVLLILELIIACSLCFWIYAKRRLESL